MGDASDCIYEAIDGAVSLLSSLLFTLGSIARLIVRSVFIAYSIVAKLIGSYCYLGLEPWGLLLARGGILATMAVF